MEIGHDIDLVPFTPVEQQINVGPPWGGVVDRATIVLQDCMIDRNPHNVESQVSDQFDVMLGDEMFIHCGAKALGFRATDKALYP